MIFKQSFYMVGFLLHN